MELAKLCDGTGIYVPEDYKTTEIGGTQNQTVLVTDSAEEEANDDAVNTDAEKENE